MKHSVILISALLLAIQIAVYPQELQKIKYQGVEAAKDELIIKFKRFPGLSAQSNYSGSRSSILKNKKATVQKIWSTGAEHWKVSTDSIDALIRELSSNPDVEYVEPNYIVHKSTVPNDPNFKNCWAVNGTTAFDIGAMDAWGISTGDTSIVIGVIDSGIDYGHQDLKANIWVNPKDPVNGIDDDNNGYIDDVHGWDFRNNDNNPMDDESHGTHVAGIIAAKGNNMLGISGVAWNVKVAALKFLDNVGGGKTSDAINALEYCITNGIRIVNCSWGGTYNDPALYDEISKANLAGVLLIVAGGNNGRDIDTNPEYPAAYDLPNIISVAANDQYGNLSPFYDDYGNQLSTSNYGRTKVDLSAPGLDILSCLPNNKYGILSGTSQAAPFVTGAVALIKSVYPGKTNSEIVSLLLSSVTPSSGMQGKTVSGGILNVYRPIKNSGTISVKLSDTEINFGGVPLSGTMPGKKLTIYNSSAENINIDTVKSGNGFLISNAGGSYSNVLVNIPLGTSQPVDIMVKADAKEQRSYDTLIIFRFSRGGVAWNQTLRCRLTAVPKGTLIAAEEVSGSWSKAMSPIIINSTVKVAPGQKLDIEPGVEVIFFNNSGISSSQQDAAAEYYIRAAGTKQDSIYFRPFDSKAPWSGLSLTGRGKYIFEYCNFINSSKSSASQSGVSGGAIYCAGPDLRIKNSLFNGNQASSEGGAISFAGSGAAVFIDSSRFTGNNAVLGGALSLRGQENWLMNSEFLKNKSTQGIVKVQGTSASSNEKAFVYNCSFKDNNSVNGGSMVDASSISKIFIKNCLGALNLAGDTQHGVINLNTVSTALVSNCTLYDNGTAASGAALMIENVKDCVLENSILWDNNFNNEIRTNLAANQIFRASYNSIKNISEVTGNSSNAPDFTDTLSYRLSATSVLRDKGNPLEIFNDLDGSRNDLGYEGGNPMLIYPLMIDFGKKGLINSSPKTVPVELVNFYRDAVPVKSWNVTSEAFTISGMPDQMLPFKSNEVIVSFSPKEVKDYSDTLYINSGLADSNKIKILLSGVCEDINSKGGEISGELPKGVYHVVSDLHVSKGNVLTINAGVKLLFQPNTGLTVEGDLEVKGTPEEKVEFTSEADTSYTGTITVRGNNTKNILLENLVMRKMLGFNIQSVVRKIVFNKCEFTDNKNSGAFLYSQGSTAEFNNCSFTGNNTAGPLVSCVSGKLYLNNCVISRNTSSGAYIFADKNKTFIYNSSFFNNKSNSGIIIASDPAAAIFADTCKVINTILSGNVNASAKYPYELSLVPSNSLEPSQSPNGRIYLEIISSCIKDGITKLFAASGYNPWVEEDPGLADSNGRLAFNSPCINLGTNNYPGLVNAAEDMNGNFRIWGGRIDIGAYEYGSKKYVAMPEKAVLYYPGDKDTVDRIVTFTWKWVPGALTYRLQVDSTNTFGNKIIDLTLMDTVKTIRTLNYGNRYYWRVVAQNSQNTGPWSDVLSFNTQIAPPGSAPVLYKPDSAAVNQPLPVTLYWWKLKTAEKYHLQVSKNNSFTDLLIDDSSLTDTLKQVKGIVNDYLYYWRLKAVNQGGVGNWSEIRTFRTMPPIPAVPELAKPLNDSKDNTASLKLEWKPNRYTERYRLTVSEDEKFSKIAFADSTLRDTIKEVKQLKEGMKYYWKISSINTAGESYSGAWAFTTLLNAPDSLKATVITLSGRSQLQLKWKDKSNGESGFVIERKQIDNKQPADFSILDTTDAEITSYTDSTVEVSAYEYRIRSFTPFVLSAYGDTVSVSVTAVGINEYSLIPKDYMLLQNYPNPFNPVTVIKYGLPSESHVKLKIYNALGQETGEYLNEIQSAGYHQINFNAGRLSSGVYYYLIEARATDGSRDFRKVKKMMVIK